jgi:probable phosphoglycerate mutase
MDRNVSNRLLFVRHGATEPNLAGLRCGGDLDVPLTASGREQVVATAQRLEGYGVGVIVTSLLQRTLETAQIISTHLGGIEVQIEPNFGERRLGGWNLLPVEETAAALAARETPPGGEPSADFSHRIASALPAVVAQISRRPLLIGSRGVARVLGELLNQPAANLGNAGVATFDLAAFTNPPNAVHAP